MKGERIFGEPQKVRAVGIGFPGVLSAQAIEATQELYNAPGGGAGIHPTRELVANAAEVLQADDVEPKSLRTDEPRELHTLCAVGDQVLQNFSIILKMVNLEAKTLMINIILVMILVDIGQYWFQILIMILIMLLVNMDRGDPVVFLWRSCGA